MAYQIIDEFQVPITHIWKFDAETNINREKGNYMFSCILEKTKLYIGSYSLRVYLTNSRTKMKYHYIDTTCDFSVEMVRNTRSDYKWVKGTCKYIEDSKWEIEKI